MSSRKSAIGSAWVLNLVFGACILITLQGSALADSGDEKSFTPDRFQRNSVGLSELAKALDGHLSSGGAFCFVASPEVAPQDRIEGKQCWDASDFTDAELCELRVLANRNCSKFEVYNTGPYAD